MTRKITEIFHSGELEAQELFNNKTSWSERSISSVNNLYKESIDEDKAFFIEGREFFFISTSDNNGNCDCSFRGAEDNHEGIQQPSVLVKDHKTIIFPDYSGNKMYNSLGNIIVNPNIGMLFIDFPSALRLRVNGHAQIINAENEYQEIWSTAKRLVKVTVNQVFWNCKKRIPKSV
ncbi:MAG: pyridoxamine 5'-phosphate oxidase family protein [Gammaproteobacteria bacterium]|nr:pyridoxamine 5'-phosphate oxidase family protein [Gammaproteobacteria bacterium]